MRDAWLSGDNTVGIGSGLLNLASHGIGGILFLVNAVIIPKLAKLLTRKANCSCEDRDTEVKLTVAARFFIAIAVPFIGTLVTLN